MCAEPEAELGDDECLRTDQDDRKPERQVEQADCEADREFVEADREPEREHEAVPGCELADLLGFVFVLVQEHPDAEQDEHADRDVIGRTPNELAKRMAEEKTDERHRHLEPRHHQADTEPLLWRQSAFPSAAETANVSRPSGKTKRISFSSAGRGYPSLPEKPSRRARSP